MTFEESDDLSPLKYPKLSQTNHNSLIIKKPKSNIPEMIQECNNNDSENNEPPKINFETMEQKKFQISSSKKLNFTSRKSSQAI